MFHTSCRIAHIYISAGITVTTGTEIWAKTGKRVSSQNLMENSTTNDITMPTSPRFLRLRFNQPQLEDA